MSESATPPTRARLVTGAMALFARKGFTATTVGEIEEAAGLVPRRGGLYKHFPSKLALLEAGLSARLSSVEDGLGLLSGPPPDDPLAEARVVGAWVLGELAAEEQITRILEQDGDLLPTLRDHFRERFSDSGYRAAATAVERWAGVVAPGHQPSNLDLDALAVVLLSPLINYRRSIWTLGAAPLDVDEERLLDAWVDLCGWVLDGLGADDPAPPRNDEMA